MKYFFKSILILSLLSALVIQSCEKDPGEGGTATVTGSVWVRDYNSTFTQLTGEYAGADEDVYIVYGDNVGYDDKTSTDYNGQYSFKYLRPGKYTIYVFSRDSSLTSVSGDVSVVKHFEITKRGESVEIPQFIIFK